jgi:hypothetical protein
MTSVVVEAPNDRSRVTTRFWSPVWPIVTCANPPSVIPAKAGTQSQEGRA